MNAVGVIPHSPSSNHGNAGLIFGPEGLAFCVMSGETPQNLVEEGILEFTLGDSDTAISKLKRALELDGRYFDAWLALAEVHLSRKSLDEALEAAEMAHKINPDDLHINTSLSRIWVEHGNVEKAEHFAAQVRLISRKKELKGDPP